MRYELRELVRGQCRGKNRFLSIKKKKERKKEKEAKTQN